MLTFISGLIIGAIAVIIVAGVVAYIVDQEDDDLSKWHVG